MACSRVGTCPLFAQFNLKSSLQTWRALYCDGDFTTCHRYMLATAGTPVPPNLLPNGRELHVPLDQLEPRHMAWPGTGRSHD